jgi:hypothetical protein
MFSLALQYVREYYTGMRRYQFSLALQYFNRLMPTEYKFICIIVKHKDSLSVLEPQ